MDRAADSRGPGRFASRPLLARRHQARQHPPGRRRHRGPHRSRLRPRPGEDAAFLKQGYVLGTVNYLAPELCGPEPIDGLASDLFSFGVTLFEMLSGRLPYPSGTIEEVFRSHYHDAPADIRSLAGPLPGALVRLIERLLARQPKDRPSAAAVVQQLVALEIACMRRRRSA